VDAEKRRLAGLLADLSKIDARLDQIKEKEDWKTVEIREEKQVALFPTTAIAKPLMFVAFAEFQTAAWDGGKAACAHESLGYVRIGE
jgi:hypothetical protein